MKSELSSEQRDEIEKRLYTVVVAKKGQYRMAHRNFDKNRFFVKSNTCLSIAFYILALVSGFFELSNIQDVLSSLDLEGDGEIFNEIHSVLITSTIIVGLIQSGCKYAQEQHGYDAKGLMHHSSAVQFRTVEELFRNMLARKTWDDIELERISNLNIAAVQRAKLIDYDVYELVRKELEELE